MSPDESLASDYPGRRVRVMTNNRNPGLAGARNSGILAGSASSSPSATTMTSGCRPRSRSRSRHYWYRRPTPRSPGSSCCTAIARCRGCPRPEDMTLKQLVRNRVMEAHPSTVMVRRDALLGPIGLVDEELPGSYGEDFDWIIRSAQAGGFAVVAEPLVKVLWGSRCSPSGGRRSWTPSTTASPSTASSTRTPRRWAGCTAAGPSRLPPSATPARPCARR